MFSVSVLTCTVVSHSRAPQNGENAKLGGHRRSYDLKWWPVNSGSIH